MKKSFYTTFLGLVLSAGSLFGLAGHGFNDITNVYQWDSGQHHSVIGASTFINGIPPEDQLFPGPQLSGNNAQSVCNIFDTRHNHGKSKDLIAAVEFGFVDIQQYWWSLEAIFGNDVLTTTALSSVGKLVTIGIWDSSVGPNEQRRDNAIYLQDYVIQPEDVGIYDNFKSPCPPYIALSTYPLSPCTSGFYYSGNGSNIRPLYADPQGSGDHTRRAPPLDQQNPPNKPPFSTYGTIYTTIRLNKLVEVAGQFSVGILVDIPGEDAFKVVEPGDDISYNLLGISLVDCSRVASNGINFFGLLDPVSGLQIANNVQISNTNILDFQPVSNGFSPQLAFFTPGNVGSYQDEVYCIRAVPITKKIQRLKKEESSSSSHHRRCKR